MVAFAHNLEIQIKSSEFFLTKFVVNSLLK